MYLIGINRSKNGWTVLPKSISATALHVADQCLARFAAEHVWRAKGPGGHAASLGTAVHGALEIYVIKCYIEKTMQPGMELLQDLFKLSYMRTFQVVEVGEGFEEGLDMLKKWFVRTSFEGVRVISCEQKHHFDVPTSQGIIPFNYIMDRFDQTADREFKVVDYKSSVWGINPAELKRKIQSRAYGLAAAIQLKTQGIEYDKIWVEFDMLRHDPVGIVYTRQDITDTWNFIRNTLEERILPTPLDDRIPETLNPECRFCVRKQTCKALTANIAVGGVFGLSIEQIADRRAALEFQKAGISAAVNELDEIILTHAREDDRTEFDTGKNVVFLGSGKSYRQVDGEMVEKIVGEKIFDQYGSKDMKVGQWEKLCKDERLTDEQRRQLKGTVSKPPAGIAIKVRSKSAFDEQP